ncbi:hypothetical protein O3P69_018047 [Scylla paramamosain]|uniref:Uncharacterized protein n=1 Tax=Scylla paramamosain TaxID=85552 RepID=A0AAW0TID1_SCYPA
MPPPTPPCHRHQYAIAITHTSKPVCLLPTTTANSTAFANTRPHYHHNLYPFLLHFTHHCIHLTSSTSSSTTTTATTTETLADACLGVQGNTDPLPPRRALPQLLLELPGIHVPTVPAKRGHWPGSPSRLPLPQRPVSLAVSWVEAKQGSPVGPHGAHCLRAVQTLLHLTRRRHRHPLLPPDTLTPFSSLNNTTVDPRRDLASPHSQISSLCLRVPSDLQPPYECVFLRGTGSTSPGDLWRSGGKVNYLQAAKQTESVESCATADTSARWMSSPDLLPASTLAFYLTPLFLCDRSKHGNVCGPRDGLLREWARLVRDALEPGGPASPPLSRGSRIWSWTGAAAETHGLVLQQQRRR